MSSLPACPIDECRSHLPVQMSRAIFFRRFHMRPFAYPPRCASSVSSLSAHAAHDVIAHRLAHRLSLRLLIAPRPAIRHDRRGGVFARSCGAFHVRTVWYNSPQSSNRICGSSPFHQIRGRAAFLFARRGGAISYGRYMPLCVLLCSFCGLRRAGENGAAWVMDRDGSALRSGWAMSDENELNIPAGLFSSRLSPRSFDMPGGASSSLSSSRCSWLLVRLSSRLALLAPCLSCDLSCGVLGWSACYPFRPIVVLFGSPFVRQVWRGDGGLRLGLGSPRSLLSVACRGGLCMWRGGSSREACSLPPCRWRRRAA